MKHYLKEAVDTVYTTPEKIVEFVKKETMKREIKFRAWHIPTKKMFDVYSWGKHIIFEISDDGVGTSPTLPAESEDCILMQYTGLKDCKGNEIYEGDIVKPYSIEKTKNLSVIVYEFNQFRIKGAFLYWNWDLKQVEVVGNIYENPELL